MSPLTIHQVPSMVSLAQYFDSVEDDMPEIQVKHWDKLTPHRKVNEMSGSYLPAVGFASTPAVPMKKVKSFADFAPSPSAGESEDTCSNAESGSSLAAVRPEFDPQSAADRAVQMDGLALARSYLDALIMHGWEERAHLLRYSMADVETKLVTDGPLPWIAQLNEGRYLKKRPTEVRVDQVVQPYDASKFNFNKALQEEVLFQFERSATGISTFHAAKEITEGSSPNLILVNVSPIEYAHILLCPGTNRCQPQLVDENNLTVALHLADETNNEHFRLGYNSLGAYGTINHMHYQAYYLQQPYPVELCETTLLGKTPEGVTLHRVEGYPCRLLAFEVENCLEELARSVARVCKALADANVPHNLLICDKGHRVFLYPNLFSERMARGLVPEDVRETQINPAAFEISGHILVKKRSDYEVIDHDMVNRVLREASCCEPMLDAIVDVALGKVEDEAMHVGACGCDHCTMPHDEEEEEC
ncbi:unnamed protein product [Pedinophyceae sp. YPF-701]|nr:unnamed protein product [Pedinophyceae sp. YPF-701]